jgi:hypothetical protein
MITKEEVVKILSGNHFLKSWEIIAEEILALNEKEGFPKYKKYIGINMGSHPKCWNGTVYPIENQVDLDNLDRKNWIVCSKEEYDKQQLKEQIANLKHGEWYNIKALNYDFIIKFDKIHFHQLYCIKGVNITTKYNYPAPDRILTGIDNIKSITPATNEEVVRYLPDEFKVKLDYEILAYKIPGNAHREVTKISNGTWNTWNNWSQEHVDEQVKKGIWKIKRLKRLSDGEVFSIGDYFTYTPNGTKHKITGITNGSNVGLIIHGENNCSAIEKYGFNKIIKVEQPILVTEDGVGLFAGDNYWYLVKDRRYNITSNVLSKDTIIIDGVKRFSTKEAAEEYIIMNKPCLSIKEFNSILNEYDGSTRFMQGKGNIIEKLKQLVKSK